jgi:hypothetical protein
MTFFCEHNSALGRPGEGIHSYRFGGVAIVDYAMTIALAVATTTITKIPLTLTTVFWFVFSIGLHWLFCVDTNTRKYIGL